MNIYDYTVKGQDGQNVSLQDYKGKVLLIVNTATGCGFTPQYEPLEKIYQEYQDQGFEILDFPCNQFRNQAPGSDEEIHTFCTLKYGTTFPQFSKVEVIGENADPLFQYLEANTQFKGFGKGAKALMMAGVAKSMDKDYKNNGRIKWNFTKFLIDRNGNIVGRFEPTEPMNVVEEKIKEQLEKR